jgi:hypothetical protein
MKRIRPIIEKPFVDIFNEEWKRAKKLLSALKRKPTLYWADSIALQDAYARCNRRTNQIKVHHWFKHVEDTTEFRLLLRHEFAHLPLPTPGQASHGADFKFWNNRLGGSRYVSNKLSELRKKKV